MDKPEVSTYKLQRKDGSHIRMATQVKFPDGQVVRFIEKMSKREALQQAPWHLEGK